MWKDWLHSPYASLLKGEVEKLRCIGISQSSMKEELGWETEGALSMEQARTWKRRLQHITSKAIRKKNPFNLEFRIR